MRALKARSQRLMTATLVAGVTAGVAILPPALAGAATPEFSHPTRIDNPYLPLSSTERVVLRGVKEGAPARSVRRRLHRTETFRIRGRRVKALIVEDRAYASGVLREIALDYYAQADDRTVYYLGEGVDNFDKTGSRVVNHDGAFRFGRDTDTLGIAMPGHPRRGQRFTFERIPGQGSETNRVASVRARVAVRAGSFRRALRVRGYVQPDKEREVKWYAPGVGLLKEKSPTGTVELVSRR